MRLYIIRHADPDYPNNTITPEGHLEAQALVPNGFPVTDWTVFMLLLWGVRWIRCDTPPILSV